MDQIAQLDVTNSSDNVHLNLDGCKDTKLDDLSTDLVYLSLSDNGLESLKGFPVLKNLQKLDLSENFLSEGFECLADCTELVDICLVSNKITSLTVLSPFISLKCLRSLDIFGNEVCNLNADYRKEIFALLPQLKFLDGLDVNGDEDVIEDTCCDNEESADEQDEEVDIGATAESVEGDQFLANGKSELDSSKDQIAEAGQEEQQQEEENDAEMKLQHLLTAEDLADNDDVIEDADYVPSPVTQDDVQMMECSPSEGKLRTPLSESNRIEQVVTEQVQPIIDASIEDVDLISKVDVVQQGGDNISTDADVVKE